MLPQHDDKKLNLRFEIPDKTVNNKLLYTVVFLSFYIH